MRTTMQTLSRTLGRLTAALPLALVVTLTACEGTTPNEPDSPAPETAEPGTPQPGTPEPGTPEPGTPQPGTPEPGTPEPGTPEPGTPEPDPIPGAITPSLSPKVKFMGGVRLRQSLATGLGLTPNEVCTELGTFDCVDTVHKISLGGVDAEYSRIDEPFETAPISTPIAVDRLALNACALRAERDFAAPGEAVVFGALAAASTGLADTDAVHASVQAVFQRLLRRAASADDLTRLDALATETTTAGESPQTFATLACFIAASSMEHLFY